MNRPTDLPQFRSVALYVPPWSRSRKSMFVPDAVFNTICNHLRGYFAPHLSRHKPPRLLGVQGPAGDGKTEMTTLICSHVGCNTLFAPAAALAGKHEGDACSALLHLLDDAKRVALTNDRPSVVILDDVDRSVAAACENTGRTINSELLVGALQDIANDQGFIATAPHLRIPVILTGNNFTSLPQTLTRPGRMRLFAWQPSCRDKGDMWLRHFNTVSWLEEQRLRDIVRRYHARGEPLAFFVDLLHAYREQSAALCGDCVDILQAARSFDNSADNAITPLDFTILDRLARELHKNKARSFLAAGGSHEFH